MSFGSCRNCGCAWDPGESWEEDRIGDDCPGCAVVSMRREVAAYESLKTWVRKLLDDNWRFLSETQIGVVEGDTNESGRMATYMLVAELVEWEMPPDDDEKKEER